MSLGESLFGSFPVFGTHRTGIGGGLYERITIPKVSEVIAVHNKNLQGFNERLEELVDKGFEPQGDMHRDENGFSILMVKYGGSAEEAEDE